MCKAFSCIVDQVGKVTWKLGIDSHSELARIGGYADRDLGEFAKVEITPNNGNYLYPDEWVYRVDESPIPKWCGIHEKELCLAAHKKWLTKLDKFIVRHPTVNPFKVDPPKKIGPRKILLLKKWDLVRDSVGDSVGDLVGDSVGDLVWDSVGDSVGASVRDSVWASVGASVRDSVWASVRDSVGAYMGSFFRLPTWKYVNHPKGKYPYQPLVDLWNMGLVPSFDGKIWRLHGGPKAKILFEISKEDLRGGN